MFLEKERISSGMLAPKWVYFEHLERYKFARQFVKDKIVVDCACGSGIGSKMFAEFGAKKVEAFDISLDVINLNEKRNSLKNLHFYGAKAEKLPTPDYFADVFISLETIEHLTSDIDFLVEVRRVLAPNGIFIVSTPNRSITNPGKTIHDKPFNRFHVREYDKNEFFNVLKGFFKDVIIYGQNPVSEGKVRLLSGTGKLCPGHGAARLNQIFKLHRFVRDSLEKHAVEEMSPNTEYEYLVAVCL